MERKKPTPQSAERSKGAVGMATPVAEVVNDLERNAQICPEKRKTMDRLFYKLDQEIAARSNLASSAKIVYAVIVDSIGQNRYSWIGKRAIARRCGLAECTVVESIKRLEALGLLAVERRGNGKSNHYSLPQTGLKTRPVGKTDPYDFHTPGGPKTRPEPVGKPDPNQTDRLNQTHTVRSGQQTSTRRNEYTAQFEAFWESFTSTSPSAPGSKKRAFGQWKRVIKDTPAEEIIRGVALFAAYHHRLKSRSEFVPSWKHAERWLKARDWESIPEPQRGDADWLPSERQAEEILREAGMEVAK